MTIKLLIFLISLVRHSPATVPTEGDALLDDLMLQNGRGLLTLTQASFTTEATGEGRVGETRPRSVARWVLSGKRSWVRNARHLLDGRTQTHVTFTFPSQMAWWMEGTSNPQLWEIDPSNIPDAARSNVKISRPADFVAYCGGNGHESLDAVLNEARHGDLWICRASEISAGRFEITIAGRGDDRRIQRFTLSAANNYLIDHYEYINANGECLIRSDVSYGTFEGQPFPTRIVCTNREIVSGKPVQTRHFEMEIRDVDLHATPPDTLFTPAGLGLPNGTVVASHSEDNAPDYAKALIYWDGKLLSQGAYISLMSEQSAHKNAEAAHDDPTTLPSAETSHFSCSAMRLWTLAIAAAAMCIVVGIGSHRLRSTRGQSSLTTHD